MHMIEIDLEIT